MKFWQLEAINRWHGGNALPDALSEPAWKDFKEMLDNFELIVQNQDREKIDKEVPLELSNSVLSKLTFRFAIHDGNLRRASDDQDQGLTSLDIANRYGGEIIEEILEKGSVRV